MTHDAAGHSLQNYSTFSCKYLRQHHTAEKISEPDDLKNAISSGEEEEGEEGTSAVQLLCDLLRLHRTVTVGFLLQQVSILFLSFTSKSNSFL